ncbi:MAG: hypothetical protein K2X01_02150 [Cyanobacteria bacterium]|nr:hypothetical protein [Cyanobacteriota bacterium]
MNPISNLSNRVTFRGSIFHRNYPHPIHIGDHSEKNSPQSPPSKKPGQHKKKNLPLWCTWGALSLNLIGGPALIAGSILTSLAATAEQAPAVITAPSTQTQLQPPSTAPHVISSPPTEVVLSAREMEKLAKFLTQSSLGLIAASGILGSLSELGVGRKTKQPSYFLGNLLFLAFAPLLAIESQRIRGLGMFLLGIAYSGWANVVANRFVKKEPDSVTPPEPERAQDFGFLFDATLLKQLLSKPEARKIFSHKTIETLGFILKDQALVVLSARKAPKLMKLTLQQSLEALRSGLSGKKLDIAPNADRARLNPLLLYLGGGLMLVCGDGTNQALTALGAAFTGTGLMTGALESFAIGTQRKDWIGWSLKWGLPLKILGDFFNHTNWGYGTRTIGEASAYTLCVELNQEESAKSPAKEPLERKSP